MSYGDVVLERQSNQGLDLHKRQHKYRFRYLGTNIDENARAASCRRSLHEMQIYEYGECKIEETFLVLKPK